MPEMNGFETFEGLQKVGLKCPVLAFTADTYEETWQQIEQSGMHTIVIKPYTPAQLKKAMIGALA